MTCAACASRIEKGLKRMDGVNDASVNLALETSNISYQPDKIEAGAIKDKIEKLGYHVVTEKPSFRLKA